AIFALRRWVSQAEGRQKLLYDKKNNTGVLVDKKYKSADAQTIVELLHFYKAEDWRNPDTFKALAKKVASNKVAVAHLVYWHLLRMAYPTKLPAFNPAAPLEDREKFADSINDLVDQRKLPPPLPQKKDKEDE